VAVVTKINRIINNVFSRLGYVRVYDLENYKDNTLAYMIKQSTYLSKYFDTHNDYHVEKYGVCFYHNGIYKKCIMYNATLKDIKKNISMIKDQNVNESRIEILTTGSFDNITKIEYINGETSRAIDITNSLRSFYDHNKSIKIEDMIIFHLYLKSQYSEKNNESYLIIITKELFDDDTFEHKKENEFICI
jgi:hypothetical protein